MQETQVPSLGWKDPWRRKWQPTPVLLPGKFQGQRSLVGYSPWDRRVRHECATNFHIHFQMVMGRASGKAPAEVTWFWSCWDSAVGSCHCMSLLHFATRPLREGSRFAHSVSENHSVMSDSFAIPWTVAHQAPLSMGFPRQEYWSSLPFPSPGFFPNPHLLHWQADSLPLSHWGSLHFNTLL